MEIILLLVYQNTKHKNFNDIKLNIGVEMHKRVMYSVFVFFLSFFSLSPSYSQQQLPPIFPSLDASIFSSSPTTNTGSSTILSISNQTVNGLSYSFIYFSLPSLPTGSTITGAYLGLYCFQKIPSIMNIEIGPVLGAWSESLVNWNNKPTVSVQYNYNIGNVNQYTYYNVTQLVKDWYMGNEANNGFNLITTTNESSAGFYSRENTNYYPKLFISYSIIPAVPTPYLPVNTSIDNLINPIITWQAATYADSYRLQVSTDPNFTSIIFDQGGISGTSKQITNLNHNTKYYWHVNATNSSGTSSYSTIWSFTTIAERSLAITSVNPSSGVYIVVSPNDNNGQNNGTTQFQRKYDKFTSVTLTAPATVAGNNFLKWQKDGFDYSTNYTVNVVMELNHIMTAIYQNQIPNVLFEENFNSVNAWITNIYKGNGTFDAITYDNENCARFYMIGSPGVVYTYKKLDNTIPSGSKLTAKWFYETSGTFPNSENSDGGYIRFLNKIPSTEPLDNDIILSLFKSNDYPMHQWNEKVFTIDKEIPIGNYIAIGGAVWPSYIINYWDYIKIQNSVTDVNTKELEVPTRFILEQNYPNPFNPSTIIKYDIPKESFVTIIVYDVLGREVIELVNKQKSAGRYQETFNAAKLASGIYFYRIQAGSFVETKKMILMR